jgi:hypothetical protein
LAHEPSEIWAATRALSAGLRSGVA